MDLVFMDLDEECDVMLHMIQAKWDRSRTSVIVIGHMIM